MGKTVTILLLQGAPPQDLVLAMALSYALSLAGMLLAYLAYRKRQKNAKSIEKEKRQP